MINLESHHKPENFSDSIALAFTKLLRLIADTFFKKKYGHRDVNHGYANILNKKEDPNEEQLQN